MGRVEALDGDQTFIRDNVEVFRERRDLGASMLNQADGLSCSVPNGAFYLYVDCRGIVGKRTPAGETIETDGDFAKYLLDSRGGGVGLRANGDLACRPGLASPRFTIASLSYESRELERELR